MDREAAVIRSEMNDTRAAIDRKLSALEFRAHELTPRVYVKNHLPEFWAERVIGTALTVTGAWMAWSMYRKRSNRRQRLRMALSPGVGF